MEKKWHNLGYGEDLEQLQSSQNGLSCSEFDRLLQKYGPMDWLIIVLGALSIFAIEELRKWIASCLLTREIGFHAKKLTLWQGKFSPGQAVNKD